MDDASPRMALARCRTRRWLLAVVLSATGCTTYVGTTAKSFLGHVRNNPDPNVRYVAYTKLASDNVYETEAQKREAVQTLIERYEKGREPVAIRAVICRTLGELRDPTARSLLLKALNSEESVIRVEACRALGKVGRPEDATILARIMTLDNLEDARIAAIEGLAELDSKDPRIYKLLVEGMDHEDPAIRLASVNTLRKLTRKDLGVETAAWRKELEPILARADAPPTDGGIPKEAPPGLSAANPSGLDPRATPRR